MNKNIKVTIGLSLVSIAAAAILLICKKYKCPCCKETMAEKCCDTESRSSVKK